MHAISPARWCVRTLLACGAIAPLVTVHPARLAAQPASGIVAGRVADSSGAPVSGASVQVRGTHFGAMSDDEGRYRIPNLAVGPYHLIAHRVGYAPDSITVEVIANAVTRRNITMRPAAALISGVNVTADATQGTRTAIIEQVRQAPTIENVIGAEEIKTLPNANAADAATRLPGVSAELDEGEAKFVEVRGAEPRLTSVTIDGAHVPGTEGGARDPRLDDIPADLIGALTVNKTLTADMDADAVGGSVDIATKVPDGRPHGEFNGELGYITLLSRQRGATSLTYGGRLGHDEQFGFLVSASYDRNNLTINDLEPTWATGDAPVAFFPSEFSLQADAYTRTRYGAGGGIDYHLSSNTTLYLKGMYSKFLDHGELYVFDVGNGNGAAIANGATRVSGLDTGATMYRLSQNLTPTDQLYTSVLGGRTAFRHDTLSYRMSVSGTTEDILGFRATPFNFGSPAGVSTTIKYDFSNPNAPYYSFPNAGMATSALNPQNFYLRGYENDNTSSLAHAYGAQVDYAMPHLKIGLKWRDEGDNFVNTSTSAQYVGAPLTLASFLGGSFQDPAFYAQIHHFQLGPVPNDAAVRAFEAAHPALFPQERDTLSNALGSFSGDERIYAAYALTRFDAGPLNLNLGLRLEHTVGTYSGHLELPDGNIGAESFVRQYTDVFPSAQLKLTLDKATDIRLAASRAIGRPNYSDLSPSVNGLVGDPATIVMIGNPNLKPERAWNLDLLAEHFLGHNGLLSAGAFFKSIDNFIFVRSFPGYRAPPFDNGENYRAGQPQNGSAGTMMGLEADWNQHFTFLPGVLSGLGLDANGALISSSATLPIDSGGGVRHARLPRQSPALANLALVYERGPFEGRASYAFQAANIQNYGDGTSNPATGDQYFYDHGQVDASIEFTGLKAFEIELEAQNLNNAVFGFYAGTPKQHYSFQREYYGQTFSFSIKRSF